MPIILRARHHAIVEGPVPLRSNLQVHGWILVSDWGFWCADWWPTERLRRQGVGNVSEDSEGF